MSNGRVLLTEKNMTITFKYDVLNELVVLSSKINDYNRLLSNNKSQIILFISKQVICKFRILF
jgi:hypothetical protein